MNQYSSAELNFNKSIDDLTLLIRSITIETAFQHFLFELRAQNKVYLFSHRVRQGPILFVGEGNLSFSLAIARMVGKKASNILSTTFEGRRVLSKDTLANAERLKAKGAKVHHNIDATKIHQLFQSKVFKTIVFQFPNAGSRDPKFRRNPNHHLLKRFLQSAKQCLTADGEVAVSVVNRSYYLGAFDLPGAALKTGFHPPSIFSFYPGKFPGYIHTNTNDDGSAISRYRTFSTWVFKPK